jgi:hypothetical protein
MGSLTNFFTRYRIGPQTMILPISTS